MMQLKSSLAGNDSAACSHLVLRLELALLLTCEANRLGHSSSVPSSRFAVLSVVWWGRREVCGREKLYPTASFTRS